MTKPSVYVGKRFGMLVVTELLGGGKARARCDCNASREVWTGNLTKGATASCGCTQSTHKFPQQPCLLQEVWR